MIHKQTTIQILKLQNIVTDLQL